MAKNRIVQEYMTHLPHEIQGDEDLNTAIQLMREKGVRHLPVFEGTQLKGILSDRDVKFAMALLGPKGAEVPIREVCTTDLYVVSPVQKMHEVVQHMVERKLGSALVKDGDVLVGIFTSTDAMRALVDLYKSS